MLVLIGLTNLILAIAVGLSQSGEQGLVLSGDLLRFDTPTIFAVSACVATVIGLVVLYNWVRFSQGGRTVVEALGGRPVVSDTRDSYERRAQNIVQEIALAANMPVPPSTSWMTNGASTPWPPAFHPVMRWLPLPVARWCN